MTPSTTSRLCEPNSTFKYVSSWDTATLGILAKWQAQRKEQKQKEQEQCKK